MVRSRPLEAVNPEMGTGEIEVTALELEIQNVSKTLPFELKIMPINQKNSV